jgi:hypothetical protein
MGDLACSKCNGCHDGYHENKNCPKRIMVFGRYYRVIPIEEFVRRRLMCIKKMNRDRDDAWDDLQWASLFNPDSRKKDQRLLPISSTPYMGRMFVEREAGNEALRRRRQGIVPRGT